MAASSPMTYRLPWATALSACLAACGSRTPLHADPEQPAVTGMSASDASPLVCISGSRAIPPVLVELYFMIDKSRSMTFIDPGATASRWDSVSSALTSFISAPQSAGLGAGIAFFPRTKDDGAVYCQAADYAFPVVPVGVLPAVAPSILTAIALQTLSVGTPTAQALEGALTYARSRLLASPDHRSAVVMVTDGEPRECGSTLTATSAIAADALLGDPPIPTYVMGVGPKLDNLDTIAKAGGTTEAYLVESGGEEALLAALEAIRTSALSCEYVWSRGLSSRFEDAVVTTSRAGDRVATAIEQVTGRGACGDGAGWFYDRPVSSEEGPTKITLCPASCSPLVRLPGSHLDVRVGCADNDR
jgi:hypothetical protein